MFALPKQACLTHLHRMYLGTRGWEVRGQETNQNVCSTPGPHGNCGGELWVLSFEAPAKPDLGSFSGNSEMVLARPSINLANI